MAKYTNEQLQEMAKIVLKAKEEDDFRGTFLISAISAFTDMPVVEVEKKIEAYARGEFKDV